MDAKGRMSITDLGSFAKGLMDISRLHKGLDVSRAVDIETVD
jgi:hypothetical protein